MSNHKVFHIQVLANRESSDTRASDQSRDNPSIKILKKIAYFFPFFVSKFDKLSTLFFHTPIS